jgi:hypothetical protein
MLTTKDLIGRMTPLTLASLLADLSQYGNHDARERETAAVALNVLEANVGHTEAEQMIAAARRGH